MKAILFGVVLAVSLSSFAGTMMVDSSDVSVQYKKVASHIFGADDYEFTIYKGKAKALSFVVGTTDAKAQKAVQYFNDNAARAKIEGRKIVLDIGKVASSLKLKDPDLIMKNVAYLGPKPPESAKNRGYYYANQTRVPASVHRR